MTMATCVRIEDVRRDYPNWHIQRCGDDGDWGWTAQPAAEAQRPPWFDLAQLRRGLRTSVVHFDPLELGRLIAIQDRLRREMAAAGERPYDGDTYVDRELRELRSLPTEGDAE